MESEIFTPNDYSEMKNPQTSKYEINMCEGPLFRQIVLFVFPLVATYILQLLFNAADLIVIGHYAHYNAMAAIGATLNLNALVVNMFIGLSVGTNVVVARLYGANDMESAKKAVRTSLTVSVYGGFLLMFVGLFAAKPLLVLMRTPPEILPLSVTYIRICFCAIPFIMVYNFGCAVLRAVGDTRRPLVFLIVAGIVNVLLNLILVIGCGMDVAGVAWATAASHGIAAILILRTLHTADGFYRFRLKSMGIDMASFTQILRIGIPAGIQSSCFAISNMLIQSTINSFGAQAIAGNTAANVLEGITYVDSFAFHQTAISFTAQNLGGRKYKRILRSLYICFFCASLLCFTMGMSFYLTGNWWLSIINPNPRVIEWGLIRMKIMFTTYAFCGIMDTATGGLRGFGYSATATTICLFGACVFRIFWIYMVFPFDPTMENLLYSYPVSWALTAAVACAMLFVIYRKLLHNKCRISTPWLGLRPSVPRGLRYLGGSK